MPRRYDASVTATAVEPETGSPEPSEVPELTRRRLSPLVRNPDPWSWLATGVVTLIAAVIRLVNLDRPNHIVFDETYYAPNAYALLKYGVEWNVPEGGANPVNGAPVFGEGAAYVVHPPLGKWLIALGEWAFGYNPFGWRIAAALAGIATVLMVVRIARRLFGSTVLGAAAGLLVALDGMHVVMSRTALLDIFLPFFLVAAFGTLLLDRDATRRRWLAAVEQGRSTAGVAGGPVVRAQFAWPWWRFATAALLGCAVAVKWSGAFFIPVFLVLVILWEVGARRSAGVRRPWADTFAGETGSILVSAVIVPLVYLASWTGWFATDHGYNRHKLNQAGQDELPVIGPLLNLIDYHLQVYRFHDDLSAEHPFDSPAWQWLLNAEPTAFAWSEPASCGAPRCAAQVLLLGTPVLWWAFIPAIAVLIWLGIARRDWRAAAILLMIGAGIVPWFVYGRTQFFFYALPAEPFLVLAVVYVLGALVSPARAGPSFVLGFDRRVVGAMLAGAYVLLVAFTFGYFYPIYTGEAIPYESWQGRMWVSTWL
jgi:dolichyl-phosphate-mannose-protein mannosyltransferase